MRLQIRTMVGLALLLACGEGGREGTPGAGAAGETGMSADTAGMVSGDDTASTGTPTGTGEASLSGILSRLELANAAEIQTSELATKQAQSPAVKKMANTLLTHHRQNRTQLESLAKQKNVDLVPAEGGNTRQDTAGVLALRSLEGAAFDSAFVAGQIEAHETNIDAIRSQMLPSAKDAEVRQFLEKTQAAMEKHLAGLQEIRGQLQR
jgi:putative membrane protein